MHANLNLTGGATTVPSASLISEKPDVKTTVAIIDSQVAIREMLCIVFAQAGGFEVIGQAENGIEARKMLARTLPQIAIIDLLLSESSGVEVLKFLRTELKATRAIVYSATRNPEITMEALREEPHGYVTRCDPLSVFLETVRAVTRGCRYYAPSIADLQDSYRGTDYRAWTALSGRERTVVQLIAEGKTSKEVAMRLSVSPKTVDNYRTTVMQKLNLRDVTALTRFAARRGLVSLDY